MSRPLRIGVNALYLIPGGVGGTEIYLRNLLAALSAIDVENEYYVLVNRETAGAAPRLTPAAPNFHEVVCPVRAQNRPWRLLWEQTGLAWRTARLRLDVLFGPGFTSPALSPCPRVTVLHDLQHRRRPEHFGAIELLAWRAAVWTSARVSREILTVSENSRRDILEAYGLPPDRVHVIPHGVEPELFEPPSGDRPAPWPYLLSISTIHPHKNWGRWLEAYAGLAREGASQHLVIAGLRGKYAAELDRQIEARGLRERVHPAGWLERQRLRELLKHADALVFPSTFEGFGMPVLEAMAAGVPVACSDIPPLREVAGDAALLFDPLSAGSIASAVRNLLSEPDLRRDLIERGRRRAAAFTWRRAAERTLAVLRRAAGRGAESAESA